MMAPSPSSQRRLPRARPSSPLVPHHPSDDYNYSSNSDVHDHSLYHASSSSKPATANGFLASPSPCRLHQKPTNDPFTDITGSLRPVQEYHNAFNPDDPSASGTLASHPTLSTSAASLSSSPPKSAPSTPSQFSAFTSASRAFIAQHSRQQSSTSSIQSSIPNLLPTITTSFSNLGRAISPERSRSVRRHPKPAYDSDSSVSTDDDSDASDSSDSSHIMATYTGSGARIKRPTGYTTYKRPGATSDSRSRSPAATPAPTGTPTTLSGWLSRGNKARSPDRLSVASSSRASTPEPSIFNLRATAPGASSGLHRTMSFASDSSATPRSTAAGLASSPSRFSALASSMTATLSRLKQQPASPRPMSAGLEHDEFYNLNIDAALFPSSLASEHDTQSSTAFKNLEANAKITLTNLLEGYRQRTVALKEVLAEKSVRDEELEEAETRAKHLKMQLEGMARKASEQEKEMSILMDELVAEKKSRARERAMLMAGMPATATGLHHDEDQATTASSLSEDLDAEEAQRQAYKRRQQRQSDGSYEDNDTTDDQESISAADSAADEDEARASSTFSRSRSPTIAPLMSNDSILDGASGRAASHPRVAALGSNRLTKLAPAAHQQQQSLNKFQKLVRNMTATTIKDDDLEAGGVSCHNCQGQDVGFAWNTVSILRDENKELKQRVGQLEVAVEHALDVVNSIGMD